MDYQPLDVLPSSPESDNKSVMDLTHSDTDSVKNCPVPANPTIESESEVSEGENMSESANDGHLNHLCLPYGGVPNRVCLEWLEGRDNDGWANHRGNPHDWHNNINASWGSPLDSHPVSPLVNLREDFGSIGLTWQGARDRDTSLDHLGHEDWAHIQLHKTTKLTRIMEHGEPTFTGYQILERYNQVEEEGAERSKDVREMDARMETLYKHLQLLARRCAFAARQVGALHDAKANLQDLKKIAYTLRLEFEREFNQIIAVAFNFQPKCRRKGCSLGEQEEPSRARSGSVYLRKGEVQTSAERLDLAESGEESERDGRGVPSVEAGGTEPFLSKARGSYRRMKISK
ncbi:hypothetical protein BT96DRAFT_948167 [Gymnopus androsaceus JB14]|uniref:Uncharacterized protein n=1 Tax=Gymnopus androsaceus JB14 TaxID=1447944 RepID=A0A6A4GQJ8_9AGAR|nr:hypothetical protein BT96DRAFT_948167 [Gymnopus androsaceus JB14]